MEFMYNGQILVSCFYVHLTVYNEFSTRWLARWFANICKLEALLNWLSMRLLPCFSDNLLVSLMRQCRSVRTSSLSNISSYIAKGPLTFLTCFLSHYCQFSTHEPQFPYPLHCSCLTNINWWHDYHAWLSSTIVTYSVTCMMQQHKHTWFLSPKTIRPIHSQ